MKTIIISGVLGFSLIAGTAAAGQNHTPVCKDQTVLVAAPPAGVQLNTVNFDPATIGACTDADGDPLSVVSVSSPGQKGATGGIDFPYPQTKGESFTVTYTVTDPSGATAKANLTVKRS